MKRMLIVAALAFTGTACAYFNALYNAQRLFAQAERSSARGHASEAQASYALSIEKAAKSLRQSPEGRWSDDALFLIGRARFALGQYREARVALQAVRSADRTVARGAIAYLGATETRLGNYELAVQHLDSAIARAGGHGQTAAFAHLWRARARFHLDEREAAWADLDAAASIGGVLAAEAWLEGITRAAELREPEPLRRATEALFARPVDRAVGDSVKRVLQHAAAWAPGVARDLLLAGAAAPLPVESRAMFRLAAAEVLLTSGEREAGEAELQAVASRGEGEPAHRARVRLARLHLADASETSDVLEIRPVLLPSVADREARDLLSSMQALIVLLERAADTGQPLALFAAGELARDELRAPRVARRLFISYADVAPTAVWSGKALLAALALDPDGAEADALRSRLAGLNDGPYASTTGGADPAGYADAEERLDRVVSALRREARDEGARRDVTVAYAVLMIDSLRAAALADSLRVPCGNFVDSIGISGALADSVRSACVRRDSVRVDSLLRPDTLPPDTLRPDTLQPLPQRFDPADTIGH